MWASSTTYTLNRAEAGAKNARSRRSRASSTSPWEAASISVTSMDTPRRIDTHCSHTPHGSGVGPFTQFRDAARMRADDVLPQPRGPLNR